MLAACGDRRRRRGLRGRRRAGDRRARLRDRDDRAGRRDRRARQPLRHRGEAAGLGDRSASTGSPARASWWSSPTAAPTPTGWRSTSAPRPSTEPTACSSLISPDAGAASTGSRRSSTTLAADRPSVADAPLALVRAPGLELALTLADALAPEHLELAFEGADELAARARVAGCVFVGSAGAAAFGDYAAGSNHVLPTGGAARFGGPLGPAGVHPAPVRSLHSAGRRGGRWRRTSPRSPAPRDSRSTANRRPARAEGGS